MLLINIGEQVKNLSASLKDRYAHLPINEIRGLRNRIAHDYTGIDYEMVFDIIKTDIPSIKVQLQFLVRNELTSGNFDRGELNAARNSLFYRHVDFDELI